jgi:PadR family transcriptional regulator, regulatory protein PadR
MPVREKDRIEPISWLERDVLESEFPCTAPHRALYVEATGVGVSIKPSKSEMPQGTLDMVILRVVAAGPIHGYALAQRIRLISRDVLQIQQGSLYPALHRLENRGLLAADWNESETGRDAKFYRLTTKGRAQLKIETTNWARLSEAITLILEVSEGRAQ